MGDDHRHYVVIIDFDDAEPEAVVFHNAADADAFRERWESKALPVFENSYDWFAYPPSVAHIALKAMKLLDEALANAPFMRGQTVRWQGQACSVLGSPIEEHGPNFYPITMIGDDQVHWVEDVELERISRDQYCGGCGSTSCGHGR